MILVTVGTQLIFDRLIKGVEQWGLKENYNNIVFQIGNEAYKPSIGKSYYFIGVDALDQYMEEADLVIGHAGMGTILTCLTQGKPLVIMPRLFKFGEHRNDHQLATFNNMKDFDLIFCAEGEGELSDAISSALASKNTGKKGVQQTASPELIEFLKFEINK